MANQRKAKAAGAAPGARPRLREAERAPKRRRLPLAYALAAALLLASCNKEKPRPAAPLESPRALALDLRSAALATGGNDVWVKGSESGDFPPSSPDETVQVLAMPHAFGPVCAELRRRASASGIRSEAQASARPRSEREILIHFLRNDDSAGVWNVREVPQIRRAAIIIDDMGANENAAKELLALPYPLTFSVLPHLRYSVDTADDAHRAGREVMLHLPMEAIPRPGFMPTDGEIREGMDRAHVDRLVESDLAAVPYVGGVNNHEGSLATQDSRLMADVMQVLAARRLFFVDSRTTGGTVALQAARRAGLPSFFRSVFLDDAPRVDYTLGQLRKFRAMIEKQGMALAIGHPHPTTIRALEEFLPQLSEDDIELLPVSRLVVLPEARHLKPN